MIRKIAMWLVRNCALGWLWTRINEDGSNWPENLQYIVYKTTAGEWWRPFIPGIDTPPEGE